MFDKSKKFRSLEIVVYREHYTTVEEIYQEIDELKCPALLSPLHNQDVSKKTGKLEKEHFHLLLFFDKTISLNQAKSLSARFNNGAQNLFKEIVSKVGAIEYLWHKNSQDKAQYNKEDVKCFGGANLDLMLEDKKLSKFAMIVKIIAQNEIKSFKQLTEFLLETEFEYLLETASQRAYALDKLFHKD